VFQHWILNHQREVKKKKKRKKNRTKKSSSLLILCHSQRLCMHVCFRERCAEGPPGATPAPGHRRPLTSLSINWCTQNFTVCQSRVFLAYIFAEQTTGGLGWESQSLSSPAGWLCTAAHLPALPVAIRHPVPHPLQRESTLKFLVHRRYLEDAVEPLGHLAAPGPGASSVGVLLLLLAREAGQPGAHQHGRRRAPARAVVGPTDVAGPCKGNRTTSIWGYYFWLRSPKARRWLSLLLRISGHLKSDFHLGCTILVILILSTWDSLQLRSSLLCHLGWYRPALSSECSQ